jgi:ankyrin repeat protein
MYRITHLVGQLGTLLKFRKDNQKVNFHHPSAKDFLMAQARSDSPHLRIMEPLHANQYLATYCLLKIISKSHLIYPTPWESASSKEGKLKVLRDHEFLEYSLKHWFEHLREAVDESKPNEASVDKLWILVDKFLETWKASGFTFRWNILTNCMFDGINQQMANISGLELLCALGLTVFVRRIIISFPSLSRIVDESEVVKSALIYAIRRGHESTVELLIDYFNISSLDDASYRDVISDSAWTRRTNLVRKIMRLKKSSVKDLVDAIIISFTTGDEELLDEIAHDETVFADRSLCGRTALHELALRNPEGPANRTHMGPKIATAIALYIVSQRVDPNETDDYGFTALHYICWNWRLCSNELVRGLIENGADPFMVNKWGQTAFHFAAQFAMHIDVLKTLLTATSYELLWTKTAGGGNTALHWTVHRQERNQVHERTTKESTNEEVFKYLLECGADPQITNNRGLTPLTYGQQTGASLTNQLLLRGLQNTALDIGYPPTNHLIFPLSMLETRVSVDVLDGEIIVVNRDNEIARVYDWSFITSRRDSDSSGNTTFVSAYSNFKEEERLKAEEDIY